MTNGIEFFPFDVNFFDDDKLALIEAQFGFKGSYVAVRLLCKIYSEGYYYKWDGDACLLFSKKLGAGFVSTFVNDVVIGLVRIGFFDKAIFDSTEVLTSYVIQKEWVKFSNYVGEDFIISKINLLGDSIRIPKYKLNNSNKRMYNFNVKKWHRIANYVFKRDNYTCQYCGKVGGILEVDHIIPFSKGGKDTMDNLTTSCRKCNRKKKDKSVEEFIKWKEIHE